MLSFVKVVIQTYANQDNTVLSQSDIEMASQSLQSELENWSANLVQVFMNIILNI